MVVLEPSTICTETNKCIAPTTNFNLTDLNYGVSYTLSISACSCDGCGVNTLYNFVSDGLTKTELIERLTVVGNINYDVQKTYLDYTITLFWKEPVQSCALFYSVNIQNAEHTSESEIFNTTHTSLQIHLSQGTKFFVSVAGANGGIMGPHSTPTKCIYIEMPGIVTNINGKISGSLSDANYNLYMDWAPPTNGTCTRPQVINYVVSLNDVDWYTSTNNTNKQLSTTLFSSEDTTVLVYIQAINSVGTGPTKSISLQLPNKAISCTLSGCSISFIVAVFACLLGIL